MIETEPETDGDMQAGTGRQRQTDRHTDGQANRQTCRKGRSAGRQTETDRPADGRQAEGQTYRQAGTQIIRKTLLKRLLRIDRDRVRDRRR